MSNAELAFPLLDWRPRKRKIEAEEGGQEQGSGSDNAKEEKNDSFSDGFGPCNCQTSAKRRSLANCKQTGLELSRSCRQCRSVVHPVLARKSPVALGCSTQSSGPDEEQESSDSEAETERQTIERARRAFDKQFNRLKRKFNDDLPQDHRRWSDENDDRHAGFLLQEAVNASCTIAALRKTDAQHKAEISRLRSEWKKSNKEIKKLRTELVAAFDDEKIARDEAKKAKEDATAARRKEKMAHEEAKMAQNELYVIKRKIDTLAREVKELKKSERG